MCEEDKSPHPGEVGDEESRRAALESHYLARHGGIVSTGTSLQELEEAHHHDHTGPCGIRNHDEADRDGHPDPRRSLETFKHPQPPGTCSIRSPRGCPPCAGQSSCGWEAYHEDVLVDLKRSIRTA